MGYWSDSTEDLRKGGDTLKINELIFRDPIIIKLCFILYLQTFWSDVPCHIFPFLYEASPFLSHCSYVPQSE